MTKHNFSSRLHMKQSDLEERGGQNIMFWDLKALKPRLISFNEAEYMYCKYLRGKQNSRQNCTLQEYVILSL